MMMTNFVALQLKSGKQHDAMPSWDVMREKWFAKPPSLQNFHPRSQYQLAWYQYQPKNGKIDQIGRQGCKGVRVDGCEVDSDEVPRCKYSL